MQNNIKYNIFCLISVFFAHLPYFCSISVFFDHISYLSMASTRGHKEPGAALLIRQLYYLVFHIIIDFTNCQFILVREMIFQHFLNTGHSFLIQLISNSGDDRMDIFSFLIQGWKGWKGWERIKMEKKGNIC